MKGFQEMEIFDSSSKEEDEANFFAAELLLEDERVLSCLSEHSFLKQHECCMYRQLYWTTNSACFMKRENW